MRDVGETLNWRETSARDPNVCGYPATSKAWTALALNSSEYAVNLVETLAAWPDKSFSAMSGSVARAEVGIKVG